MVGNITRVVEMNDSEKWKKQDTRRCSLLKEKEELKKKVTELEQNKKRDGTLKSVVKEKEHKLTQYVIKDVLSKTTWTAFM